MQIVVLGNKSLKEELLQNSTAATATMVEAETTDDLRQHKNADAYIDLLFENTPERITLLQSLQPALVIINSVVDTLQSTDASFIRINGWSTFLKSPLVEASCTSHELQQKGNKIFAALGKEVAWVPDVPGFITPRVISMIVNEAYLALAEGVSTREEIDTAMQLGTAYPYGPFEWSKKIGLYPIVQLLETLSRQQSRYTPAALLVQEADSSI